MRKQAELPIQAERHRILEVVKENAVTVLIGETGSGKSTQLSQILDAAGYTSEGKIAITQPRRVAAVTVARHVAEEYGCEIGEEVGYSIRFEDRTSRHTKIVYLTDGTLLRQCLEDSELNQYSVIILDEAHERSLNTDILFGVVKHLARHRKKPLKIIITSATLDGEKFSAYFGECPVLEVSGRVHEVQTVYSKENFETDIVAAAIDTALDIHQNQPPGDILVFMTGQAEIDKAVSELRQEIGNLDPETCGDAIVLPLYAALPPEQQVRIFSKPPEGCRRIIVATNIAETSVTVDGVVYVVDTGRVKEKSYNPQTGIDALRVIPISRVQAKQRTGRAGRTKPGLCFRLYTRHYFEEEMAAESVPEIQRSSLLTAILHLKSLPLTLDVLNFDFLDAPRKPDFSQSNAAMLVEREAIEDALRQLYILGCVELDGQITELGRRLAKLPLDPTLGKLLLSAIEQGCLQEACTICAMLSADSIFLGNRGPSQVVREDSDESSQRRKTSTERGRARLDENMADGPGDHILYLRLFQGWQESQFSAAWAKDTGLDIRGLRFAKDVRTQLLQIAEAEAKKTSHGRLSKGSSKIRKAILAGYANKMAARMSQHNGYKTFGSTSTMAQLHPSSCPLSTDEDGLLPDWIIFHELLQTSRTFLSKVCPVKKEWVIPILDRHNLYEAHQESLRPKGVQIPAALQGTGQNLQKRKSTSIEDSQKKAEAARERFLARKKMRVS